MLIRCNGAFFSFKVLAIQIANSMLVLRNTILVGSMYNTTRFFKEQITSILNAQPHKFHQLRVAGRPFILVQCNPPWNSQLRKRRRKEKARKQYSRLTWTDRHGRDRVCPKQFVPVLLCQLRLPTSVTNVRVCDVKFGLSLRHASGSWW